MIKQYYAIAFFALFTATLHAQKYKSQQNLSFGLGWHASGFIEKTYKNNLKPTGLSTTPVLVPSFNYDFGFSDRVSLGLSYAQYQAQSSFTGYTNSANITNASSGKITLKNKDIGLRILFHTGDNDDLDTYLGIKTGYSINNFKSTVDHGFTNEKLKNDMGKTITYQGLLGFRYFLIENIGIGFEFAAGQTYNALGGLNIRLGMN